MSLRPADEEFLKELGNEYEVGSDGSFVTIQIRSFRLPEGLSPSEADLLLRLPPGFPDASPDMFWMDPPVQRRDGSEPPATNVRQTHSGRSWQRWSRHIRKQWRPGIDNLSTYLAYVRRCLDQAAENAGMKCTLALSEPLWEQLCSWVDDELETAGVLIARMVSTDEGLTLVGRQLIEAPEDAYLERTSTSLALRSNSWVPALRKAAREHSVGLFVHSHPTGPPTFSERDDQVDRDLISSWQSVSGTSIYGSIVISREATRIAARIWADESQSSPVSRVRIVGDRIEVILLEVASSDVSEVHARQLLALGEAGQEILRSMHVGIVGAGGTGSPIAEQLIRLGVGALTVIDDDEVTSSTISRGYGSAINDIGRPKVEVTADVAHAAAPNLRMNAVVGNVRDPAVARQLAHCDLVFCCADGHAARLVLNRMAYWHLMPVIDVAVLVSSDEALIRSVDARVTWLAPGTACLLCRRRLDAELAYAEQLDPEERRALAEQGYAPDLDEPQASVIAYTSLVASLGVAELLGRLFEIGDSRPSELLMRVDLRELRLNRRPPRQACFCGDPTQWGRGIEDPYLDLTWLT